MDTTHQLTERDLDIFSDLDAHRLLNTTQLASLHCHSVEHIQRLRRRLQKLRLSRYVQMLETPIDRPRDYILSQRGMNALANARHAAPRRVTVPRSTRSYREHDVSLSDFTVTLDLFFRDHPTGRMISEVDLINRSPRLDVRSHRGWPVAFSYRGQAVEHWVKPDRFIGAEFCDRPKSKNTRYYSIELDRGTMPLEASSLEKASILRKLLSYETTIDDRILEGFFLIPHCHILFLTIGKRRRDNMVQLAQTIVGSDRAAEAMLFAVQPQPPSVGFAADLTAIEWVNGRGRAVTLPL